MTPKCRILCPTFGGHIKLPSSQLLLFVVLGGNRSTGSPFVSLLYPISGALSIASRRCAGQFCEKPQGDDCHWQSSQRPNWSSIPRQCAHWHGICWMRGCFRRKRRNPASLYQVRAGRILKEGGLVCGSKPFSASLSRILSPFLGGTRKGPPEGHPAEILNRASVRTPPALTGHLQLCILRICRPQAAAGKFFKKRKKGLDKTGCVRYNTEAVSAVPELH